MSERKKGLQFYEEMKYRLCGFLPPPVTPTPPEEIDLGGQDIPLETQVLDIKTNQDPEGPKL